MAQKLVVIGAGMASRQALEHLFNAAPGVWDVTFFNTKPRGNHNRIMLSPVLSGEKTYGDIIIHDADGNGAHGVTCHLGEAIISIDRARKVVIIAAGRPGASAVVIGGGLLENDLKRRGIMVDECMVTSDPDILSVGECVDRGGMVYGLVVPLFDMARMIAKTLTPGDFAEGEGREEIVYRGAARGVYQRLVIEGDRLIGAVMYGETGDGSWFFGQMKDETDVSDTRDTLIFGPAYAGGTSVDPMAAVAALPDNAEICGCNGVCEGQIVAAMQAGAGDLDAVPVVTKASGSCRTCTGLVEQVLVATLGDCFKMPVAKPVCTCTDMTHEDVRRLIKSQALKSMPAVMQQLG
jgi:NAD(P)H-nitrite reductase large subunit